MKESTRLSKLAHKLRGYRNLFGKRYLAIAMRFEGRTAEEALPEDRLRRRKRWMRYGYNTLFAALIGLLLAGPGPRSSNVPPLRTGEIADIDIASPVTADIEPREPPKATRDELAKKVAPVFDYDDTVLQIWLQNWESAFQKIRQGIYTGKGTPGRTPALFEKLAGIIRETTGQSVLTRDLAFLHQNKFSLAIEGAFRDTAKQLVGRLIAPSDLFPSYYSTGIVVRQVNQALNETLVYDVTRIWSLDHAREFLKHMLETSPNGKEEIAQRASAMVSYLIIPNVKYNAQLTQKRINAALGLKRLPLTSVRRGQILVRRGDRVTDSQAELLQSVRAMLTPSSSAKRFFIGFLTMLALFGVLMRMELSRKSFWKLSLKDALLFMGITLINLIAVKYLLPYLKVALAPMNLKYGVEYLMPISAGGIIIHLMMGREAGFTYALLVGTASAALLDRSFNFSIWAFAVTGSAIQAIRACKQRTDLYRSGIYSGAIGAALALAFALNQTLGFTSIEWGSLAITVGLAFTSGLLSTAITSSLIPVVETLFNYTTSLKLLELSNFNHPLLHTLMMKAPGTYHHSIIVGSLAEIAADRVKANALLARVSAYYHDIGKMNKPLYFIENQVPNQNPHDHLNPTMSAKILFSHVKNGVRLGREHNLGSAILGVIEQHHGTTLVSFFFNKAKDREKVELDPVNESDFRYPGPRPQTREAAIVMIADACEAATRSISDPTPQKIQTMVRSIINKRFLDSQFSDCDLTMADLQIIEDCFTRTLVSLYHHRIEYPGQKQDLGSGPAGVPIAAPVVPALSPSIPARKITGG